jgi:hypothetical protein
LSLCYAMKVYVGADVYIHIFLTLALAGSEWSASRPHCFTPGERDPGTHWMGGWVDPTAGLDDVEKREFLTLLGLADPLVIQPAIQTILSWLHSQKTLQNIK